jgi:hypothetical protein
MEAKHATEPTPANATACANNPPSLRRPYVTVRMLIDALSNADDGALMEVSSNVELISARWRACGKMEEQSKRSLYAFTSEGGVRVLLSLSPFNLVNFEPNERNLISVKNLRSLLELCANTENGGNPDACICISNKPLSTSPLAVSIYKLAACHDIGLEETQFNDFQPIERRLDAIGRRTASGDIETLRQYADAAEDYSCSVFMVPDGDGAVAYSHDEVLSRFPRLRNEYGEGWPDKLFAPPPADASVRLCLFDDAAMVEDYGPRPDPMALRLRCMREREAGGVDAAPSKVPDAHRLDDASSSAEIRTPRPKETPPSVILHDNAEKEKEKEKGGETEDGDAGPLPDFLSGVECADCARRSDFVIADRPKQIYACTECFGSRFFARSVALSHGERQAGW